MSRVGLCRRCRHSRVVESRRGSRFWLCRLSSEDPRFPRYPVLPVTRCVGFEQEAAGQQEGGGGQGAAGSGQ